MNKLIIPPLIVGFICLFLSMAIATSSIGGNYSIDSKGNITNSSLTETNLTIVTNGLETPGSIFTNPVTHPTNNQTGNTSYNVYNIITTDIQYWVVQFSIHDVIGFRLYNGNNPRLTFETFSTTGEWSQQQMITSVNSKFPLILDLLLKNDTDQSVQGDIHIKFASIDGNTSIEHTVDNIIKGYNYSVTTSYVNGSILSTNGNFLTQNGFVILFITAAIIGGISAITIFGSKIDFFGQKLIFASATFIALWVILSLGMYSTIMAIPIFGIYIWLALSAMYFLGIVSDLLTGQGNS
jgi:hypothetical protein